MEDQNPRRELLKGGLATLGGWLASPLIPKKQSERSLQTSSPLVTNDIAYVWSGALTHSSIKINVSMKYSSKVQILYQDESGFELLTEPLDLLDRSSQTNNIASFTLNDLKPDMTYLYWVVSNGVILRKQGRFKTPRAGVYSYKFAFGNCCKTGSESSIFLDIAKQEPLFFLQLGDLHYENITIGSQGLYREAYRKALSSSTQAAMYSEVPSVYMWDDHDFGGDNADKNSNSADAAQRTYRQCVPHYPLPKAEGAIYHSFVVGRIKFVVTDGRSNRDPSSQFDDSNKSMLGKDQKAWLKNELLRGKFDNPLTIWVNNVPWISQKDADTWAGYSTERNEIANFIEENEISNIAMLGGDAHILAIDDGRNNRFGDAKKNLFPVFHAGPLDSNPVYRGGPYEQLAPQLNNNYGIVEIFDYGQGIDVFWSGYHVAESSDADGRRSFNNNQQVGFSFSMPEPQNKIIADDHKVYLPFTRKAP